MELFDNITDKTKFANCYSLPECFLEKIHPALGSICNQQA